MRVGVIAIAFAASLLAALHAPASHAELLGITFGGDLVHLDENTATPIASPVASGFNFTNSLARDPSGEFFSATNTQLIRIDFTQNKAFAGPTLSFDGQPAQVLGLAFSANGVLYGVREAVGEFNRFFKVDVATGTTVNIGTTTGFASIHGLTFAPDGTLYGWDTARGLIRIDPLDGSVTDVNQADAGAAIESIAFNRNGKLFGVGPSAFYGIDPAVGTATLLHLNSALAGVRGVEFSAIDPMAIPEPSTSLLLAAGLALLVVLARSRSARQERPDGTLARAARPVVIAGHG